MPQPEFKISHDSINKIFKGHIDPQNNDRIIFSAPFGTGKTTFLKDFFNEIEGNLKEYKVVHLYPINYAVSNNEDIFELIKYDIFYELLTVHREELKLEEHEFSKLLTFQSFILNDFKVLDVVKAIIKNTSEIGKSSVEIIEVLTGVIKTYEKNHKNLQINVFDDLLKHLESQTKNKGSIIEFDEFSELIGELLLRLKAVHARSKTVLIIDDLDRMDPEHIFRLFNVFSAHHDLRFNKNKFGFDKVIFVCDIENIRKIFQHRYGQGVDFSGYIDKFFSVDIFFFDNRNIVSQKIEELLAEIKVEPATYNDIYNLNIRATSRKPFVYSLQVLLISLIDAKQLDLRSLIRIETIQVDIKRFKMSGLRQNQDHSAWDFLVLMNMLKFFAGDSGILLEKLKFLSDNYSSTYMNKILDNISVDTSDVDRWIASYCIPFINNTFFLSVRSQEGNGFVYVADQDVYLHYDLIDSMDFHIIKPQLKKVTKDVRRDSDATSLNVYKLVYQSYLFCIEERILT